MSIGQGTILEQVEIRVPLPHPLCANSLNTHANAIGSLHIGPATCKSQRKIGKSDTGVLQGRLRSVRTQVWDVSHS